MSNIKMIAWFSILWGIANSFIKLVYIYNVLTLLFNSHIKVDKKYITIWFGFVSGGILPHQAHWLPLETLLLSLSFRNNYREKNLLI